MNAQSSTLGERLPPELYREITVQLHPRKDASTLLSLSLVSRALRIEGQRVLFSIGPISEAEDRRNNPHKYFGSVRTQAKRMGNISIKFLESIGGETESLAGYVLKYGHFSSMFCGAKHNSSVIKKLLIALPLMHNLKFLSIDLRFLGEEDMIDLAQIRLSQLHTLSITVPNGWYSILTTFLRSQMALTHMNIFYGYTKTREAINLFNCVVPSLISLRTNHLPLWEMLAGSNDIKAVYLPGCENVPEKYLAAVRKLKYLHLGTCIDDWGTYLDEDISNDVLILPTGADLVIEVLRMHMDGNIHKTVHSFTGRLGRLRILIAWEVALCEMSKAVPLLYFRRVAAIAFTRSTNLLYVVVPNHDTGKSAYVYGRSAQEPTGAGPVLEEYEFDWDMGAQSGPDWWVGWEDILSGKSTLGLIRAHARVVDMSDMHSSDGLYGS